MQYVTYDNLFEFVLILATIVSICYTIFKHKKITAERLTEQLFFS